MAVHSSGSAALARHAPGLQDEGMVLLTLPYTHAINSQLVSEFVLASFKGKGDPKKPVDALEVQYRRTKAYVNAVNTADEMVVGWVRDSHTQRRLTSGVTDISCTPHR